MRQRHQATANRIDAISRLVRQGRADGSIHIEHEDGDDVYSYTDIGMPLFRGRRRTLVTIEIELHDYDLEFLNDQAIMIQTVDVPVAPKQRCRCPETYACPIHNWQHKDFGNPSVVLAPPIPDYHGAVKTLVRIINVIEKAEASLWAVNRLVQIIRTILRVSTMDDSSKRFKMLELD